MRMFDAPPSRIAFHFSRQTLTEWYFRQDWPLADI